MLEWMDFALGFRLFMVLHGEFCFLLDVLHCDWNVGLQEARIRSGRRAYGSNVERCARVA